MTTRFIVTLADGSFVRGIKCTDFEKLSKTLSMCYLEKEDKVQCCVGPGMSRNVIFYSQKLPASNVIAPVSC